MAALTTYTPPNLLYHGDSKAVEHVVQRVNEKVIPSRFNQNLIEFEISHDQFSDLCSYCINLRVKFTPGDAATLPPTVNSALDLFESVQSYYRGNECDNIQHANAWNNAFLNYSGTHSYFSSEANMLIGYYSKMLGTEPTSAIETRAAGTEYTRDYTIPLPLLFGLARMQNHIPVLGSKIRFVLNLARGTDHFDYLGDPDDSMTIENATMTGDIIKVSEAFRQAFIKTITSGEQHIKMSFSTFDTQTYNCSAATTQNVHLNLNHSNNLSLFMLRKQTVPQTVDRHRHPNLTAPLPFSQGANLQVRSGTVDFTNNRGIESYPELYAECEKCVASLCSLDGAGIINYPIYTREVNQYANTVAGSAYGYTLVGINLEKDTVSDDNVLNMGYDGSGGRNLDIVLKTSTALSQNDQLYLSIVYKKVIDLSNGGIVITD